MNQKATNNTPLTKKELLDVLKNYPTKDDLTERLTSSQKVFRNELENRFQIQDENWDRRFSKFANQILIAIDPLLKEIKTRQQEREIVTAQISDVRMAVKDHEKRIKKLEHS